MPTTQNDLRMESAEFLASGWIGPMKHAPTRHFRWRSARAVADNSSSCQRIVDAILKAVLQHTHVTYVRAVSFLLVSLLVTTSSVRAQSIFEANVGWGSPGGAVLEMGAVWFRVQDGFVEFQAILQDPIGQTASLQPVLMLSGGELPFSLGTGQHFTVAQGFRYQNPFIPAPPFDPNAPVTDNYFQGTSFAGSFQGFAGLENRLLSEGVTWQITYDGGSISGPLAFVAVPEPSSWALSGLGALAIAAVRKRRKS